MNCASVNLFNYFSNHVFYATLHDLMWVNFSLNWLKYDFFWLYKDWSEWFKMLFGHFKYVQAS